MISKTNIEKQLQKVRSKRITEEAVLQEVQTIFSKNEDERNLIINRLNDGDQATPNIFNFDLLESDRIYHRDDIKQLCIDYRLRFLDSRLFKGNIPEEAVSKIRTLENTHQTTLEGFKIVAPAKLMKLQNADDPLLFAPMGNQFYYLIHKWGNDLHPLRKLKVWPYKSFENLVITIFLVSMLLTYMAPLQMLSKTEGIQEYGLLFLFIFKGVAGTVLFYGFAKGKNFNNAIWNSKYYNA